MGEIYKIREKIISTSGKDFAYISNENKIEDLIQINELKDDSEIIDETGLEFQFQSKLEIISQNRKVLFKIPCFMGIINITPDSFSDGGKYFNINDAVKYGIELIDRGVDIIDIGGESTRPGAELITPEEEIKRVIPVIEGILKERPHAIISLDTNKSNVAEEGLKRGCLIINDISGGQFDEKMFSVIAKFNAAIVIMHTRSLPKDMQSHTEYSDLLNEISIYFEKRIAEASKEGVKNIILDPGIGFAKTIDQNYQIIKNLNLFSKLGFPLMIGLSRKSFIGNSLGLKVEERDFPTSILETVAINNGVSIVRTHNPENLLMIKQIFNNLKK